MSSIPTTPAAPRSRGNGVPRVIVATTALLTFISFWRAAAIVLNDLASSAYYAGGEAEGFIGKTAPWFILAIMLFSYAVRAVYVESCSMFVRGGVYRAVKQSLGGGLAKFSVSALMFDYILTGPISGVAAGQYLAGLMSELSVYFHLSGPFSERTIGGISATFAVIVTVYFWWENIKGITESSEIFLPASTRCSRCCSNRSASSAGQSSTRQIVPSSASRTVIERAPGRPERSAPGRPPARWSLQRLAYASKGRTWASA